MMCTVERFQRSVALNEFVCEPNTQRQLLVNCYFEFGTQCFNLCRRLASFDVALTVYGCLVKELCDIFV